MSARSRSAQRRSASSLPVSAGTLTWTPGRLSPLWSDTTPPVITLVRIRPSRTAWTSSTTRPSSTSTVSPGRHVAGQARVGGRHLVLVPRDGPDADGELLARG